MPTLTELFIKLIKESPTTEEKQQKNREAMTKLLDISRTLTATEGLQAGAVDLKATSPETIDDAVWNFNLLQLAIFYSNEAAIGLLLNAGANVNEVNECGTALWVATYFNQDIAAAKTPEAKQQATQKQINTIQTLLRKGANVNQTYDLVPSTPTPLHVAVTNSDYPLTRLFLLNGAHTNIKVSSPDNSPTTTADKLAESLKAEGPQAENTKKVQQLMATVKNLAAANDATNSDNPTAIFTGQQNIVAALRADFNFTFAYLSEIATACTKASQGDVEATKSPFHQPVLLEWALSSIKTMIKQSGFFNRLNEEQCTSIMKLWGELREYNADHRIKELPKIFASNDKKSNFLPKLHQAQIRIKDIHAEAERAEHARQRAAEEAQQKAQEEAEAKRKAQEDAERRAKEEADRKVQEELQRKANEDAAKIRAQEEAAKHKAQQDVEARHQAAEAQRKTDAEALRKAREDAAALAARSLLPTPSAAPAAATPTVSVVPTVDLDAHKDTQGKSDKKRGNKHRALAQSRDDFDVTNPPVPPAVPASTPAPLSAPLSTPEVTQPAVLPPPSVAAPLPPLALIGDPLGVAPSGSSTYSSVTANLAQQPLAPPASKLFDATSSTDTLSLDAFDPRNLQSQPQTAPPLPAGTPPLPAFLPSPVVRAQPKVPTANAGSPARPTPSALAGSPSKKAAAKSSSFWDSMKGAFGGEDPEATASNGATGALPPPTTPAITKQ